MAHCTLTGKGVNNLCQALITNKLSLNSLTYLNLSGNCLKEEVTSLINFLAQPNVVSILDLSSIWRGTLSVLGNQRGTYRPHSSSSSPPPWA